MLYYLLVHSMDAVEEWHRNKCRTYPLIRAKLVFRHDVHTSTQEITQNENVIAANNNKNGEFEKV
jgi:hypothetical protein